MMEDEQEDMLGLANRDEEHPLERALERERLERDRFGEVAGFRQRACALPSDRSVRLGDDEDGLAVDRAKRRSEGLVTGHECGMGAFEARDVDGAPHAGRDGNVVRCTLRLEGLE